MEVCLANQDCGANCNWCNSRGQRPVRCGSNIYAPWRIWRRSASAQRGKVLTNTATAGGVMPLWFLFHYFGRRMVLLGLKSGDCDAEACLRG